MAEHQALKTWAYQVTTGAETREIAMTQPSEVYAWLQDHPVGAFVVVSNALADRIMVAQGGLMYRDNLWHIIKYEATSPGTGCLFLVVTPYKDRNGAGAFVALSNVDTSQSAGRELLRAGQ